MNRSQKIAVLSFLATGLLALPTLALAHPEDDLNAPPIAPQFRAIGGVIVLCGVLIMVITLLYHSHRRKAHSQKFPNTRYPAKGLRPILYSVLAIEIITAVVLRTAGGRVSTQELERMRLRGNAQDASVEVEELLQKTPEAKRVALLSELADDVAPGLRFAAIDLLRSHYKTGNETVYERAFLDCSGSVRERALESLTDVNPVRALPLLLAGIQDSDISLRHTAVQKLSQLYKAHPEIVNRKTVPVLVRAFENADPLDRASLSRLLSSLTGNPWIMKSVDPVPQQDATLEKWLGWWRTVGAGWGASPFDTIQNIDPVRTEPAPSFAIPDVDGKKISLNDQRGRVTMLNFWGTWCGPCKVELPDLIEVQKTYAKMPFDLIGLGLNEPDDAPGLKKRSAEMGVTYRQAICTREVQRDYGEVTGVPVTVLIDKQGQIRYRWDGNRDLQTFRHAIDRLLKE